MSSDQATKLVFLGALATAAVVVAKAEGEEERFRALWAIGLLFVALAALADFAPQLAGPFAALVAVAAVSRNPGALGRRLGFEGGGSPLRGFDGGNFGSAPQGRPGSATAYNPGGRSGA